MATRIRASSRPCTSKPAGPDDDAKTGGTLTPPAGAVEATEINHTPATTTIPSSRPGGTDRSRGHHVKPARSARPLGSDKPGVGVAVTVPPVFDLWENIPATLEGMIEGIDPSQGYTLSVEWGDGTADTLWGDDTPSAVFDPDSATVRFRIAHTYNYFVGTDENYQIVENLLDEFTGDHFPGF